MLQGGFSCILALNMKSTFKNSEDHSFVLFLDRKDCK